jgi:hypothetical protein
MRKLLKRALRNFGYELQRIRRAERGLSLDRLAGEHNCLIAGPFLGELGWELMQWQGYLRQLSKFYSTTIVYGRDSSAYFYKDFATEFRAVNVASWDTDLYILHNYDYDSWANQFRDVDLLVADNRCLGLRSLFDQHFVPFGEPQSENAYDILIHARAIPNLEGNPTKWTRNWALENWNELCNSLKSYRLAAVGVPALSYCPDGALDLRGVETEKLCSILASSRCCIGPSSGVMHLASLCRTPHFVWNATTDYPWFGGSISYRYMRSWNPFGTKVRVLTEKGWQPSPTFVRSELVKFLEDSSRCGFVAKPGFGRCHRSLSQ